MSFKIPCGGFKLDEKSFSLDENGVLSIPKPLTYDYMPEGYPSKGVGTVTLMEEQEVTFSKSGSNMRAQTPTLDIEAGDKLTIIWDGVSYNATAKIVTAGSSEILAFGNLALVGQGDTEDYPFVCGMTNSAMLWTAADTATSHTIGVTRQQATYTPIDMNFMPKNFNVVFSRDSSATIPDSCNVTYDELRGWIENGIPVFATYKYKRDDGSVSISNIIRFEIGTGLLNVYYQNTTGFVYNSDGTFSELSPS